MHIVLIADTFPPLRSSGAVQLRDLTRELIKQGHFLTVLLPTHEQGRSWALENFEGAQVLRLKAPKTKDVGYIRRTLAEFVMPFAMLWHLRKSPFANSKWDGVVWYSPSIFFGPLVSALKRRSGCKSYLIIRDIFPEWAADMGLMKRGGLPYTCFSAVAKYQYSVADAIGVQTPGNLNYFKSWATKPGRQLEVLQNWLGSPATKKCSIRIEQTVLAKRKVLVYAGNMGIAQGMDILLALADKLRSRNDVGFLFVGRGSDALRLKNAAESLELANTLFFDEIDPDEIPDLYAQCHVGIVALDPRHNSHNIPGKFLTYMQNGLPVLANINPGNDLAELVRKSRVGKVCESNSLNELLEMTELLLQQIDLDADLPKRCKLLFKQQFAVEGIARQITGFFTRC
ncbi:glycosyltransferase family 4 protein [Limnobacter sp.]|uniref:glycosyltransferase family 4 protein n=1 Tax=Limnobacter sp. TaxID=2003368 RepID=UPI003518D310